VAKSYDVAVIGAGVFGSWTAYHLARSGARVLLLDQHGPANARASSSGETRIIRMSYGADEIYTRSSVRSLKLWKQFFAETEQPLFHETGVLVTSAASDPHLFSTRDTLARVHCRFDWLDYTALRERFPHMVFDRATAGIYEPKSGVLMARRAVQAVVDAAVRAGARYEQRYVPPPDGRGNRARVLVYACGPWLPKLFPKILAGRIRPSRQQVFFFGTPPGDGRFAPPQTPAWITFREGVYSIPALDGRGFKLAVDKHGPPFDPETGKREITRAKLAEARAILRKRFPALADAPLVESRVCQYENTSNGDFLIDRHPEFENVWLVGGGSGHGFKHGPFVGEYVAARIASRGEPEPRFSLATKGTRRNRTVY
jgi:sarcosine oxidase